VACETNLSSVHVSNLYTSLQSVFSLLCKGLALISYFKLLTYTCKHNQFEHTSKNSNEHSGEGMRSCVQDEGETKGMEASACCVTLACTVCSLFWKHYKLESAKKAVLILLCQIVLLLPLLACGSCQIITAVAGQLCSGKQIVYYNTLIIISLECLVV